MASIAFLLQARAKAERADDLGQARAITADLARLGYVEDGVPGRAMETAVFDPPGMEHAVPPPKRGGRPKLPRCEHGKVVGRCVECEESP